MADVVQVTGRRTHAVAAGCAVVVAAVAVAVLAGWALDVEVLKRVAPGLVAMNPLTAVSCLLAAASLLLQWPETPSRRRRAVAATLSLVVVAAGVSRLLAIWARLDVGADLWMFRGSLDGNRMAPQTASGLIVIGLALSLLDVEWHRSRVRPAQLLALVGGGLAGIALVGYLYSNRSLYGMTTYVPIALHTASCFALLCTGILAARPDRGLMRVVVSPGLGGTLCRRLLPFAVIAPVFLGAVRSAAQRANVIDPEMGASLLVIAIIALFAIVIWLTARLVNRIEDKSRAAQLRYRAVVEQTAEGIYLVDGATKQLVETNPAFRRLLGYTIEQSQGLTVYDLVDAPRADIDGRIAQTLAGERRTFGQRVYRRQDGRTVDVQANATAITVDGRDMLCTVVHDITAQRDAERKIAEKSRQVEAAYQAEHDALAALRLAQSQLVQREKLAGLGQMVAGVAHEINNPLSFVANNVAVLQRDLADIRQLVELFQSGQPTLAAHQPALAAEIAELSEQLDVAYTLGNSGDLLTRSRDGLKRIQQIVRDLRDFARLDEAERQDADLNAGIESTANIIRGAARKGQVTIDLQLGHLRRYPCHPAKLNQVVMNLLSNAIDASPAEGTVTVRTRQATDGGVEIEVEDRGTGIPPDVLSRIFDPFYTTKPQGQGTGLGLSISYGIVQDHGGTIDVSSEVGAGTRFTVRLPPRGDGG